MKNCEHVDRLKIGGVQEWNSWRTANPSVDPNLSEADLSGLDLTNINLKYSELGGANLSYTNLYEANLIGASLNGSDLSRANLNHSTLLSAKHQRCRS